MDAGIGFTSAQQQKLKHLPSIFLHHYQRQAPIPESLIARAVATGLKEPDQPFDYAVIEELIRAA